MQDMYIELYYGKYLTLDLHGKTILEAEAELVHAINSMAAKVSKFFIKG